VTPARKVPRGIPEHRVCRANKVHRARKVTPAHKVPRGIPEYRVCRANKVHRAQKVTPARKVPRGIPEHRVCRANKVHRARKATPARKALREKKVILVRASRPMVVKDRRWSSSQTWTMTQAGGRLAQPVLRQVQ